MGISYKWYALFDERLAMNTTTPVDAVSEEAATPVTASKPEASVKPAKPAKAATAAKATAKPSNAAEKAAPVKASKTPAPAKVTKAAKPAKPPKAPKQAKASKPAKSAPAPAPAAAAPKAPASSDAAKSAKARNKLVRDSFTMPQVDFALIDALKQRALNFRHSAKKGELLRAGLQVLATLPDAELKSALERITSLKPGRPKKVD
jgi:outer membrane biosynthesis protein TonB